MSTFVAAVATVQLFLEIDLQQCTIATIRSLLLRTHYCFLVHYTISFIYTLSKTWYQQCFRTWIKNSKFGRQRVKPIAAMAVFTWRNTKNGGMTGLFWIDKNSSMIQSFILLLTITVILHMHHTTKFHNTITKNSASTYRHNVCFVVKLL